MTLKPGFWYLDGKRRLICPDCAAHPPEDDDTSPETLVDPATLADTAACSGCGIRKLDLEEDED